MEEPVITDGARQSLQQAIDSLYRTFARYRLAPLIDACPCCVDDADKRLLYRTGLRGLRADDLARYAFKALTTWGDKDDFRHFLPRLFELQVSATPIPIDNEILFGKLPYARWRTWPDEEQRAIERFLMAWGRYLLGTDPGHTEMEEYLCVLALVLEDITPFLDVWRATDSVAALRHLAIVARDYAYFPTTFRGAWWKQVPTASQQIETWICDPATEVRLEEAFFRYQSESFAEEFAAAADALRRTHR